MGGKRKRMTVKPTTSRVTQRPSALPTQYDFVPRDPSQSIPRVLPKNNPLPSVRDYPPPRNLFPTTNFPPARSATSPLTPGSATSQPQQRQTQSTQRMNPLPPSQAAPPVVASQSPLSSEAQNSHIPEEEEDMSDVEAPVQPNLASNNLDLLNSLLNQPNRPKNITVLSPNLEPGTTWYFLFLSTIVFYVFSCNSAAAAAKKEEERAQAAAAAEMREEERSRVIATQQATIEELSMVRKYLTTTDQRFLDFISNETASSDPNHV
ncbi:hypothetical protein Bca4012_085276 [Brassica carinata]